MNSFEYSGNADRRRVYAEVDVAALDFNIASIRKRLPQGTGLTAVVKADAYGHGAAGIALHLEESDAVSHFAVATAEEAFSLRDAGVKKPILLLGYTFPESFERIVLEGIRPAVFRADTLAEYAQAVEALRASGDIGREDCVHIHIAVDCGMRRIGVTPDEAGLDFVRQAASTQGIHVEGIFTHFAKADEADLSDARAACQTFSAFVKQAEAIVPGKKLITHAANSAAIMVLEEAHLDLVRAGIILYGLYPSDEVDKNALAVRPVLSLKSSVVFVKEVAAGCGISYGGTYVTSGKTRVATVSAGYADGIPRTLSGKGEVLVRGQRVPILGRVCMDQFMIDVTNVPDVTAGDTVTIIGIDGAEEITMEEVAALSGRFHYELPCLIPPRVPRLLKQ